MNHEPLTILALAKLWNKENTIPEGLYIYTFMYIIYNNIYNNNDYDIIM